MKNIDGKLLRTLADLNIGRYTIEYVPGSTNVLADSLSRIVNLADCIDEVDQSFRVEIPTNYVTMDGGPSSIFKCLAYAMFGSTEEHESIRTTVINRLLKTPIEFNLINNKETK